MTKKKEEHIQGKTVFILGVFAIAVLLVIGAFLKTMFVQTFPGAVQEKKGEEAGVIVNGENLVSDPLVTVVPKQRYEASPKPLDTDPSRGPKDAKVTIVEFADFECPACGEMREVLNQILEEYPNDVRHVWKDFPISTENTYAEEAARAARCAQEQDAFWPYHDLLLFSQEDFPEKPWGKLATEANLDTERLEKCVEDKETNQLVLEGYFTAKALSLDTAPTYFINDRMIVGQQSFEKLKSIIDEELR